MKRTIQNMGAIFCTDRMPRSISVERVQSALEKSGLNPTMAKTLNKRGCFLRTIKRLRDAGLIEEVADTDERLTFQLSDRNKDGTKIEYEFNSTVWYDKKYSNVGSTNEEILTRAEALFAEYGAIMLGVDITRLVHKIFDTSTGMVSLKHAGGIYFVPEANRDLLNKISVFVGELGADCTVANIGIGEVSVRDKAVSMLKESVEREVELIVKEMQEMKESGKPLKNKKAVSRWNYLLDQLERITTFATSMSVSAQDIISSIKSDQINLAIIATTDLDMIAAMAHKGKVTGALAYIAESACGEELPTAETKPQEVDIEPGLAIEDAPCKQPNVQEVDLLSE